VSDRFEELAMRRRQLLLRSERLRSDLAADQRIVLQAVGGFDRIFSIAKGMASPLVVAGAGALFFGLLRRFRPVGLAMRGMVWISMAKRCISILGLVRAATRSRSRTAGRSRGVDEDSASQP
jgi:hypothetical protein